MRRREVSACRTYSTDSVFLLSCLGAGRGVEDTPPRARSLLFWLLLGAAEEEEKNAENLKPDVGDVGARRFAGHSLQLSLSFGFPKSTSR